MTIEKGRNDDARKMPEWLASALGTWSIPLMFLVFGALFFALLMGTAPETSTGNKDSFEEFVSVLTAVLP